MGDIYLSQHWHFYQPRNNDFWARIIDKECYEPNSKNGILDHVSFNVGPTLIEWFEKNSPQTLQNILEADHGHAIAQPYNHRILPLTRYDEDLKTQIFWGKEHFKKYFSRYPRGMWLSEAATDIRTSKELVNQNIEYTIGASWQGKKSNGDNLDLSKAYNVNLSDGQSIIYFFFHPISADIAFNSNAINDTRFLDNADVAVQKVVDVAKDNSHILLAYDGETFGHHHKMADKWASYFPQAVDKHPGAKMITLDEYIDEIGVYDSAELVEKSSWSCLCGNLERWTVGCNCSGGPRNYQKELLDVLEHQEDMVHDIFYDHASKLINDVWDARNDYVNVLLGNSSFNSMIKKYQKGKLSTHKLERLKNLFEAEYFTQLSFTSCGWFFSDVNIQTKNNIKDAHNASKKIKKSIGLDISKELYRLDWMLNCGD